MIVKAYPKDNEPRTLRISTALTEALDRRIRDLRLTEDDLLFGSTRAGGQSPMSRNTFRTRAWVPATCQAGLEGIRVHDLRHAHASWLLAGGADLKTVMDRLGHTQIQTTEKYLHNLPDADDKALAAFHRSRHGHPVSRAGSDGGSHSTRG